MEVILCGNPGVGKSFILNSLLGKDEFTAGTSMGSGITRHVQSCYGKDGIKYSDTPGLDDIDKREEAAEEISETLSRGGEFKLIFVCTLESGRLRPADVTTASLILHAIAKVKVDVSNRYAVIVNKCEEMEMEHAKRETEREKVRLPFAMIEPLSKSNLEFFPELAEAKGKTNYVFNDVESSYKKFVEGVPVLSVPHKAKIRIDVSKFDEIRDDLEKEIRDLRRRLDEYQNAPLHKFATAINNIINEVSGGWRKIKGRLSE